MQQNGQAESQGFSILQIIINNWYIIFHFLPTQQTGWGQRILRMLFLAIVACEITPPKMQNWMQASKIFYFILVWTEIFCSLWILFPPQPHPAEQHITAFPLPLWQLPKDIQGYQDKQGCFRALSGQMVLWNTYFCKMCRKETFLSSHTWLKPCRLWELWLQHCMGSTGDGRRSAHVKLQGINIPVIERWSCPEELGLSWICAAVVV